MIKSRANLLTFCLLCLLLISFKTKSQTTVTIGDINTSYYSERYPFNGYYNYSWSNVFYLNSEVGSAGNITKLAFYVVNAPANYVMNSQKIYARHTSSTSYTDATYPGTSGFTLVYDGSITYNGSGWFTVTLTTPFSYNGSSNLEFLFENRDASFANGFPYFAYTTTTGNNRLKRDFQDASFPSTCANCAALTNILNIQITKQCSTSMTLTPSTSSLCAGSNATLSASGASTYTWSPSSGLNTVNSASVIASSSVSTIYTITGKDASNCIQTKTLSVTVLALPNLTITPSVASICAGTTATLQASGATSYTWNPVSGLNASTTASVVANPSVTTIYTVTGINSNNCKNTITTTITVNSNPTITVTPNTATICNGGSASLVASGATSYVWTPSTGLSYTTSATVNANPTTTTIYSVTGTTAAGCNSTAMGTISVTSLPSVIATSTAVCTGNAAVLSASGASTYSWSNGVTTSTISVTPTTNTSYTVTGIATTGCKNTAVGTVTVNALPTVAVTSTAICIGNSAVLSASGASSYLWSTGATTSTISVTPTTNTSYTVTGTSTTGCTNTAIGTVTVNASPTVAVTSTAICVSGSATLTATGAATYSWSSGATTSTIIVTPTSTALYSVTGSSNGCNGTTIATVTVSNVNAGTAVATGTGSTCNNSQVSLSIDSKQALAIGTGTLNSEKYPFDGYYNYSWSDVIYTQSDLGASGTISKISFYVDNVPSNFVMDNQIIYLRNTSATSFMDNAYPGTAGFTQVFSGTITYNGSGWKEITFTTPYNYNGTDNLEVLFENRDGSWANGFPLFRYSTVTNNRVKRDFLDASFPSSCSSCGAYANIPNSKFTIDRTLNSFVKWQYSYDDNTYTDLSGGTSSNFATQVKTSTYFRAQFTNGSCNANSASTYYATNNNYYVNDNVTTGDIYTSAIGTSVNDGRSPSKPKATISDVLATYTLSSCDTIFVDKGNYAEEVNINSPDAGSSIGYFVIEGAGIDATILNAPSTKNNIVINQSNYVKVEKMTLNSTQGTYNNVLIQSANNNIIANNKLIHSSSTNINLYSAVNANNNQVLNNQINNSSTSGYGIAVVGNCDNVLIKGNTIALTNASSLAGIIINSTKVSSNVYYPALGTIDQNTITAQNYGVVLNGPDFPIASYTISNNNINIATKASADGAAIWLGYVGNSLADQSLIYNNRLIGGKNGFYLSSGVDYEKIYNNYVSNSDNGLYVSTTSSDIGELYFNSFYNTTNNLYFALSSTAYWKVKNNIFYNTNNTATNACIRVGNPVTFVACNNNVYYAPNGASVGIYNGLNYGTLANWKTIDHADETPLGDENSVYGNPLYVNATTNNLDIVPSSLAAVAGSSITGITKDIYNTTRFNPPFIGAEELLLSVSICNTQTITCTNPTVTLTGTTTINGANYSWTGPNAGSPAGTTPTSSLTIVSSAGIYTLTVTLPASGETATATVAVVSNTTLPNVSAGSNNTITASSPSVTLTGSSTTPGVTYSWTPAGSSPTSSVNVVTAGGIYTLSVTNPTNGCVASATVNVIAKLDVIATVQDYISDSLKGTINLMITGGKAPYNVAWNGNKIPTASLAYNQLINSYLSLVIDSVKFKHQIDSIKQLTNNTNLLPGTYSVTVYDQNNDSVLVRVSVGMPVNSWAYVYGATTTTCSTTPLTANNVVYNYGVGQCVAQQGTYSAGNHFAIPLQPFDFNSASSTSFIIPNSNDVVYVGIQEKQAEVNGGYTDISQKTMFRFNGNSTYDVVFNTAIIYSGTFVSNDRFAFTIDPIAGNISYYKNETLLTQTSYSIINTSVTDYLAKVVLGNSNARVNGLRIISPSFFTPSITGVITDVTCDNICSGSIKATGYYPLVNAPDKYEIYKSSNLTTPLQTISAAGVSNVTFNNLCPGSYTVKYHVNVINFHIIIGGSSFPSITTTPITIQQNFVIGYKPNWTNITSNLTVANTDNSLTKTGPSNAFDAGASTFNTLLSSSTNTEWMEWTASGFNMLGLSANDPDVNFSTIGYSIFNLDLFGYHLYGVLHNGSFISGIGLGGATDKFRIEKNGSGLVFKRNTTTISTISGISPNPDVIADASMFFINGSLSHPRLSFGCNLPQVYAVLKKELDGTYFQTYNNYLLFTTDGDYSNTGINYSIYNYARTAYTTLPINSSTLKNGDNRYRIDISTLGSGYYVLELLNQKKEKLVLRFKK